MVRLVLTKILWLNRSVNNEYEGMGNSSIEVNVSKAAVEPVW